ncbi:MAG TPA: radical SAM protein [Dehalococcoidia bacterium]|nr:radical SAM protein [Dehalococcoidia bacterium]
MIGISQLYAGTATAADPLRYGRDSARLPPHLLRFSQDRKPVVVWNCSRRCNLRCIHCYADSENQRYDGELTTGEARAVIEDVAGFGAPVLLFSGGEPLMRRDVLDLAAYATDLGIRAVLSTNGTLITRAKARQIRAAGVSYVGISIDGMGETNDYFRGRPGAFDLALRGVRNCVAVGQRVGLRLTLTRHNFRDLPQIFDLIEREEIDRACFYHLVYSGRGRGIAGSDLTHEETRQAVDYICQRALDFRHRGIDKEILTVDNHADGVYVYLKLLQEQPDRAEEVLQLLRWNGGNRSGIGIACIDNQGNVHPDQFWWSYSLGNVRERPFSEIWSDLSEPLLAGLRDRRPLLKGRCGQCRFLDICNGNFRVRALAVDGDVWASDPACYLTDEEIGLGQGARRRTGRAVRLS